MKKLSLFLLFATCLLLGKAQVNCYRIYLHDKANTPYSINNPQDFLSDRAIAKRARFDIRITEEDLPVNPAYVQAIRQTGDSVLVMATSRWFNTVVVRCPEMTALSAIGQLDFVDSLVPVGYLADISEQSDTIDIDIPGDVLEPTTDSLQYGVAFPQIAIHNGHLLHNEGYKGDGMLIAMLDAGWLSFNRSEYFANLYENNQILGTYNFVPGQSDIYSGNSHGTSCASVIFSNINMISALDNLPLNFVGTAPNANAVFIRTEISENEQLMEEDFWVAGAELADSLGTDVLTASLGYTLFDNSDTTIEYSSLDGHTSLASSAATLAAHKGMVVCVAAGNEGDAAWHRISRPADAEDILAVGAVGVDSIPATFSGVGPSFDGRVKPDVASVGSQCQAVNVLTLPLPSGDLLFTYIDPIDGTSAATPCLAGLAACLWQALPQYSSLEIMQMIREAGHIFSAPDTVMGYGIPDFYRVYLENRDTTVSILGSQLSGDISVYPNPCHDQFSIRNSATDTKDIVVFDMSGKVVYNKTISQEAVVNTEKWANGLYLLLVKGTNGWSEAIKVLRQ